MFVAVKRNNSSASRLPTSKAVFNGEDGVFFFALIILGCLCLHALITLTGKGIAMQHMAFNEEA